MFSKLVDHQEVDLDSSDCKKSPELIPQKNTRILHTNPFNNNQRDKLETNGKDNARINTELPPDPNAFNRLATIQKASAIITQNLPVHDIVQKTLELCGEIASLSSGNIILNHAGKWQAVQEKTKMEFEIIFNALSKVGLVERMFNDQTYLQSSPKQLQLENSFENSGEIFSFPMIVDSNEIGVCIMFINEERSKFSASDLEAIKIIVNHAAIAMDYGKAQKQLTQKETILENFKHLLIRALRMALVGELAKGITHEINNPLQIILGKIQMAMIGMNHQDVLKHIERQSLQIASLVRTISDISKKPTKDFAEIIEINSFIKNTIDLVRGQIEKRGIKIHLNFDNNSISIYNNSDHLRQLILNSTLNAKNRMPSGGQLFVGASMLSDDTVQIEFKDDGFKLEGNFNKNILNYAVDMDKLYEWNVDLGEITNILLVKEIGGVIDNQSHESFGNKIIIRIPQNRQGTH